jgi:hypothetical protein
MLKIILLLFIYPLTSFSQIEKLYVLTNGAKLSEHEHSEIINKQHFFNNFTYEIVDSLVQNDTLLYTLDIRRKRPITFKDMFYLFEYEYIPFNEYDFAESQMFIDNLGQINDSNYYLNRSNIQFEIYDYYFSKNSSNKNEFSLKSSYTVYKNKEIIIVTKINDYYSVLIKVIDDSLFSKLKLFNTKSTILNKTDPSFGIPIELMNEWTRIRTDSNEFTFLSFDDIQKDCYSLFRDIRNVPWKNSFKTMVEEKKYLKLDDYRKVLIKNHERLKLPINKVEYPAPSIMIEER